MSEIRIGAHVEQDDPLAEAAARQAPLVQFFLGDPQGYQGPEVRYPGGAEKLRADAEEAEISHRVVLRFDTRVWRGRRLRSGGRIFDIRAVRDLDETGRYLLCLTREETS
mgnify:CR=1 FL=1